jgi:hypothetical protein
VLVAIKQRPPTLISRRSRSRDKDRDRRERNPTSPPRKARPLT